MADLLFVGLVLAFFALSLLLVHACGRIIGVDEQPAVVPPATVVGREVAA